MTEKKMTLTEKVSLLTEAMTGLLDVVEDVNNGRAELEVHTKEVAVLTLDNADRIDYLTEGLGIINVGLKAVIEASRGTLKMAERAESEIIDLRTELSALRALVLKQMDIDLRQNGVFYPGWYKERDEFLATVAQQKAYEDSLSSTD
jgi:hypothetical protein